jgi:hypothetical protein
VDFEQLIAKCKMQNAKCKWENGKAQENDV